MPPLAPPHSLGRVTVSFERKPIIYSPEQVQKILAEHPRCRLCEGRVVGKQKDGDGRPAHIECQRKAGS